MGLVGGKSTGLGERGVSLKEKMQMLGGGDTKKEGEDSL